MCSCSQRVGSRRITMETNFFRGVLRLHFRAKQEILITAVLDKEFKIDASDSTADRRFDDSMLSFFKLCKSYYGGSYMGRIVCGKCSRM